jgi:hypothetical protein
LFVFHFVIIRINTNTDEITDGSGDLAVQNFPWTELGLPTLSPHDIPSCGINDNQLPCSRKSEYILNLATILSSPSVVNVNTTSPEYFTGFIQRHPVFPPYATALYSNAAYRILAYVLEAITGRSYEEVIVKDIFEPLGMKCSSPLPPVNSGAGVIPNGDAGWDRQYGDEIA